MRVVRTPAGEVLLDPSGRLPGRGAYLCADGSCWNQALKHKALERALSAPLPAELQVQLAAGSHQLIQGGTRGT